MTDLHYLSVAETAELIRTRKLSPLELTDALLKRINTYQPQLSAFITVTGDLAREQAKVAESDIAKGNYRGPLHGVPFALKDIYNTAGILTSGGSKVCIDNMPATNATATQKLLDAGAVLLGKLQTHEFAHGGPSFDLPWPPARNPWNLAHFSGGSSSGSGVALAAGLTPAALGSDTGGSIRGPASHCGITGLMPTYGLVSRAGVIPNSFTFDHCGPMARSAEDCAILLQAIAGYDPKDGGSTEQAIPDYHAALKHFSAKGLKVGVLRHYWEEDLPAHEDLRAAMEEAIVTFRKLGATIEDCRARPMLDGLDIKVVIGECEIYSINQHDLIARTGDFGRDFLGRALPACVFQASDYVQALREHKRYMADMQPLLKKYDILLAMGFGPAPRFEDYSIRNFWRKSNAFTPSNSARTPALVMCGGLSKAGLPLGVQLITRPFNDAQLLAAGHAYQQATGWHTRRPPLDPVAVAPKVDVSAFEPRVDADAKTRSIVQAMAQRAGFKLNERQMNILLENAPAALEMAERLRKPRERMEEPSSTFRFAK